MSGLVTGLVPLLPGNAGSVRPRSPDHDVGPGGSFAETLAGALTRPDPEGLADSSPPTEPATSESRRPEEGQPPAGSGEPERAAPQAGKEKAPTADRGPEERHSHPEEARAPDEEPRQREAAGQPPAVKGQMPQPGALGPAGTGFVAAALGAAAVSGGAAGAEPQVPAGSAAANLRPGADVPGVGVAAGLTPAVAGHGAAGEQGSSLPAGPAPVQVVGGTEGPVSSLPGAPQTAGTTGGAGEAKENGTSGQSSGAAAFQAMLRQLLRPGQTGPAGGASGGQSGSSGGTAATPGDGAAAAATGSPVGQAAGEASQSPPTGAPAVAPAIAVEATTHPTQPGSSEAPTLEQGAVAEGGLGPELPTGSQSPALIPGAEGSAGAAELPRNPGTAQHPSGLSAAEWRQEIQEQVARALAEARLRAARDGQSEMRIRLEPPELGEISLKLTLRDGQIHGQILAGRPEVRAVLESQKAELWTRLEQQGLQVAGFDVGLAGDSEAGQQSRAEWGRSRPQRRGGLSEEPVPAPLAEPVQRPYGAWRPVSRLDFRA